MSAGKGKYIEREVAIKAIEKDRGYFSKFSHEETDSYMSGYQQGITFALIDIATIPAADVRPVVRATWNTVESPLYECSNCGAVYQDVGYGFNFCPNCGADMRKVVLL